MRNQVGNSTLAQLYPLHLAQLILSFLTRNPMYSEATLGIVHEPEVLTRLLNGDDIHEARWERRVGADLAVDPDEALHDDGFDFAGIEGVLETISEEDYQGHAVAELVRSRGRTGSVGAGELVEEPMRRGRKALHVLLSTSKSKLLRSIQQSVYTYGPRAILSGCGDF
jgi:hypothetical protein